MASLEQVRAIFDAGEIWVILIGMPGLEKKLARYPQFYSRIGSSMSFGLWPPRKFANCWRWAPPGVCLPQQPLDAETVAAIIRITGGNFQLLNRLLTQIERILEINALQTGDQNRCGSRPRESGDWASLKRPAGEPVHSTFR